MLCAHVVDGCIVLIDALIDENFLYGCSRKFSTLRYHVQLTSISTDAARSQPVTWTSSDVTGATIPSLSCSCTGVAQGLGGKERDGPGSAARRRKSRRTAGYQGGPTTRGGYRGGGVALTYLCRVLHATPILAGTNPLRGAPAG